MRPQRHLSNKRVATASVALIATLMAGGCSGTPEEDPLPTVEQMSSTPVATEPQPVQVEEEVTPSPSTSSAEPLPSMQLDEADGWVPLGPVLTNQPQYNDVSFGRSNDTRYIIPGKGEVEIILDTILPNKEIVKIVTSPNSQGSTLGLVGVVIERLASSGLTPESFEIHAVTITETGNVEIFREGIASFDEQPSVDIIGSSDGRIALILEPQYIEPSVVIINADRSDHEVIEGWGVYTSKFGAFMLTKTLDFGEDTDHDERFCPLASLYSLETGVIVKQFNEGASTPTECSYGDFDGLNMKNDTNQSPLVNFVQSVSLDGGSELTDIYQQYFVDSGATSECPRNPTMFDEATGFGLADDDGLEIVDCNTGQSMWALDSDQQFALSARPLSFIDGTLYLETTDKIVRVTMPEGNDADVTTPFPMAKLDDYYFMSDFELAPILR